MVLLSAVTHVSGLASCVVECEPDLSGVGHVHLSDDPTWHPGRDGSGRDVAVHEGACTDHRVIADRDASFDHNLAADVATVTDGHRRSLGWCLPARQSPIDGVVGIDVNAGADAAIGADPQPAGPVQEGV